MNTADALIPDQIDGPRDSVQAPMDTEVVQAPPMTALEKLKEELKSQRNLDVGFETTDFDINNAIRMIMEMDKYTRKLLKAGKNTTISSRIRWMSTRKMGTMQQNSLLSSHSMNTCECSCMTTCSNPAPWTARLNS